MSKEKQIWTEPQTVEIRGLRFVLTCWGCPEQYDVFSGDRQIGYVRLRHGILRVDTPECGGTVVMEHAFGECLLGQFESASQREGWLLKAALELSVADKADQGAGGAR